MFSGQEIVGLIIMDGSRSAPMEKAVHWFAGGKISSFSTPCNSIIDKLQISSHAPYQNDHGFTQTPDHPYHPA
jgi:hypothetical protein